MEKIRTSDLTGQMNFLATSYMSFLSDCETVGNTNTQDNTSTTSTSGSSHKTSTAVRDTGNKEVSDSEGCERQNKRESAKHVPTDTRRSSFGRLVRQRVQLNLDSEDEEEQEKEEPGRTPNKPNQSSTCTSKPRPTSLNPFRIPVNLLNFKPRQHRKL